MEIKLEHIQKLCAHQNNGLLEQKLDLS